MNIKKITGFLQSIPKWCFVFIFYFILTGATGSVVAGSENDNINRYHRVSENPNLPAVEQGRIEYFWQVLNKKDHDVLLDKNFTTSESALTQMLPLDLNRTLQISEDHEKVYVLISKAFFVVKKDVAFLRRYVLDEKYWRQTRPELNVKLNPILAKSDSESKFVVQGTTFIPNSNLKLNIIEAGELSSSKVQGVAELLNYDSKFGKPSFMLSENYTDFGKKMTSKTGLESRWFSKYYRLNSGATLVIQYALVYTYQLLPKIFGGQESMREQFIKKIQDVRAATESYVP